MENFKSIMISSPRSIITLEKIYKICESTATLIAALEDWNLIPRVGEFRCVRCQNFLTRTTSNQLDLNLKWRCYKTVKLRKQKSSKCAVEFSLRKNTLFDKTKAPIRKILSFICCWANKSSTKFIQKQVGVSKTFLADWNSYCGEVVQHFLTMQNVQLGGVGKTVELDESKFGKRKYNRGSRVRGYWVFGAYERGSGEVVMVEVERRDAETLIPIIRKYVKPGTRIITDCWKAYNGLSKLGYEHCKVNHSKRFCNPGTDQHTNSIEGSWSAAKTVTNRSAQKFAPAMLAKYLFIKHCSSKRLDPTAEFLRIAAVLYHPNNEASASTVPAPVVPENI